MHHMQSFVTSCWMQGWNLSISFWNHTGEHPPEVHSPACTIPQQAGSESTAPLCHLMPRRLGQAAGENRKVQHTLFFCCFNRNLFCWSCLQVEVVFGTVTGSNVYADEQDNDHGSGSGTVSCTANVVSKEQVRLQLVDSRVRWHKMIDGYDILRL